MLCSKMHELFWSICILESLPKIMKGSLTFLYCGHDLSFIMFFSSCKKQWTCALKFWINAKCTGHLIGQKWTLPPLHPFAGFDGISVKLQFNIILGTIFTFITCFWYWGKSYQVLVRYCLIKNSRYGILLFFRDSKTQFTEQEEKSLLISPSTINSKHVLQLIPIFDQYLVFDVERFTWLIRKNTKPYPVISVSKHPVTEHLRLYP